MIIVFEVFVYFYVFLIVIGCFYCGMYGFIDVIIGFIMGMVIFFVEFYYVLVVEEWMYFFNYVVFLIVVLIIFVFVCVYFELVDDCLCFDDSVVFVGVMIGLECGMWWFVRYFFYVIIYNGLDVMFFFVVMGWFLFIGCVVFGVLMIFVWREVMKLVLLKFLFYLYRLLECVGMFLFRRFFVLVSEYKDVLLYVRDDNLILNVFDFFKVMRSIRGLGCGRSVSIGL